MFNFCKPVSSKKRFLPFRTLDDIFSFTLFENAASVPKAEWDHVTAHEHIFLERDYLMLVETSGHTKLQCRYVIVYQNKKACGIIYFQIVDFKAGTLGEVLGGQSETSNSTRLRIFENYIGANKEEILLRLFTCGNNLVSGEYGFVFDKKINEEIVHDILLNIIDVVSKEEKLKGGLSAILIKDFHLPLQPEKLFESEKYSRFSVEPNLIVEIPEAVDSIIAYTELFSKKYRNRAKGIFKSFQGIETKYFELADIKKNEKEIYALYEEIFEKAKFKLIKLPRDYFSQVKSIFKEQFKLIVFLKNEEIIAFGSIFLMPDKSIEAHYIGFQYELNQQHNLYQNLLYKIINEAILNKRAKVNLGRTAAEIKTTVGAKAEDLVCYLKPQNTISRMIQKPFIAMLQPAEWIPRSPFKEEG